MHIFASDLDATVAWWREMLGALKGSFILSINDTPEIRKTFAGLGTLEAQLRYSAARRKKGQGQVTELLITSPLPDAG